MSDFFQDFKLFESNAEEFHILTPEYIYSEIGKEHEALVVQALARGEDFPAEVRHGKIFSIGDIESVSSNKKGMFTNIVTRSSFGKTETDFIVITDPDIREDFIRLLHIHMGSEYKFNKKQLTSVTASLKPLFYVLIILGVGAVMTQLSINAQTEPIEEGRILKARVRVLYYLLGLINPVWVMVFTGIALFIALVIVIRRIANPPHIIQIKPAKRRVAYLARFR
ncbi:MULTISPECIES: hypothetical protein [unclassified Paenibacillus]|uniref:hypothetical protein n=1 Tax=unclassified Paenibacillus TaxID=185978 RepID=UPI0030F891FC